MAASVVSGEISGAAGFSGVSGPGKRTGVAGRRGWGATGFTGGGREDPCCGSADGCGDGTGAAVFSAGFAGAEVSGAADGGVSLGGRGAEACGGPGEGSTHSIFGDDALRAGTRFSTRSAAEAGTRRDNFLMLLR